MKKLRLTALSLGAKEMLTREQLKNVFGGTGADDPIEKPQCGTYPDCTTGACKIGTASGTCGKTTKTKQCTCGVGSN